MVTPGPPLAGLCVAMLVFLAPAPAWGRDDGRAAAGDAFELPSFYEHWQTISSRDGLPHEKIWAIHISGDKAWVGTEGGLALCEQGKWTSWTVADGLPWPVITSIDVDELTGETWLGTWGGGIVRFSGGRFDSFTQFNSGLAGDLVFDIAVAGGRVWAASNSGVSSWDHTSDVWELHGERRRGKLEHAFVTLCTDEQSLYAGAWCGPVHRLDLSSQQSTVGHWRSVDAIPGSDSGDESMGVTLATAASGGALWLAAPGRLSRCVNGSWQSKSLPADAATQFIRCMTTVGRSEAWLGLDNGLHVVTDWEKDLWVRYHRCTNESEGWAEIGRGAKTLGRRSLEGSLPANRIRCIAFQGNDVWVGTDQGLARGSGLVAWSDPEHADRESPPAKYCGCSSDRTPPPPVPLTPSGAPPSSPTIAMMLPQNRVIPLQGEALLGPRWSSPDQLAMNLAVDSVNRAGGAHGAGRFNVLLGYYSYARYGWGTAEDDFVYFKDSGVRAIVTNLHPENRVASAVALRSEVPVLNLAAVPPSNDERLSPWMFHFDDRDRNQHGRLLDLVFDRMARTRVAILRKPGAPGQEHLDAWARQAHERGFPIVATLKLETDADLGHIVDELGRVAADVVLTWCDAATSAAIVRRMRAQRLTALFVGSEEIVCEAFAEQVGPTPGDVLAAYPCSHHTTATDKEFREEYAQIKSNRAPRRGRRQPGDANPLQPVDELALRSYRGTRQLLHVINIAGHDREAIRRTLSELETAIYARLADGRWTLHSDRTAGASPPRDANPRNTRPRE